MSDPTPATHKDYRFFLFAFGRSWELPYFLYTLLGFTLHTYWERRD